jgi:NSS family neurotransmitter:Na+ symporter
MMGKYGGAAFFAVYLAFMLLFSVPSRMAEIALGRASGGGTLVAFRKVFGNKAGSVVGFILLFSLLIAASYYAVVVGNVLFTTFFSIANGFNQQNIPVFQEGLSSGWQQYGITLLLVSAALYVVHRGLKNGIELVSKIAVPFFAAAILYLIIFAFSLPGAVEKLTEFLRPDLAALTAEQVFAALGQSFFSVGLGGTFMVAYGAYLKSDADIPRIAIATSFGDLGASLMASLFLVPTILVFSLDIASGPGLIFATLPELFSRLPMGRLTGSLFLTALSAVAFLSMIAAYEVLVSSVTGVLFKEKNRSRVIIGVGVLMALLTLPTSLYPDLIGILDLVFGSGMQVFGSVLAVLGITWGLGKARSVDQIFGNDEAKPLKSFTLFWLKWVVPAVLLSVLAGYVYSLI